VGRAVIAPGPWVHRLCWSDVSASAAEATLAPDEAARARIARTLGVEAIGRLTAFMTLTPWLDGVEIEGRIVASATRICGITLDPFEEVIDEPLLLRIVPEGSANAQTPTGGEIDLDLDADDPPDVAQADGFDLAGYVVEHLALALSPFPRKPGAVFEAPPGDDTPSPFAVLARLKSISQN
jgi:hypothetical protein